MRIQNVQQPIAFRAMISPWAQAYIDNRLDKERSYRTSKDLRPVYRQNPEKRKEFLKFAKELIKEIKAINPTENSVITKSDDCLICNVYNSEEDLKNACINQSRVLVGGISLRSFIETLRLTKKAMYELDIERDKREYESIRRIPPKGGVVEPVALAENIFELREFQDQIMNLYKHNPEKRKAYLKFAKKLIKEIKTIKPTKYTVITKSDDCLICNVYDSEENMKRGRLDQSRVIVRDISKRNFIENLLLTKEAMYELDTERDGWRHESIRSIPPKGQETKLVLLPKNIFEQRQLQDRVSRILSGESGISIPPKGDDDTLDGTCRIYGGCD